MGLAGLCAEVAKLRITLPRDAEVIPLRRAVGGGAGNAEGPETGASGAYYSGYYIRERVG